ncbi:hypothetical protein [Sphingomonas sp. R86520]|uniref:hypothetical protein n=1 Tax=Sphingomonas sp. R86520 TaxID=3093859 RepID=UPI0036D2A3EC
MTDSDTNHSDSRLRDGYDSVRETASKVYHDASDKAAEALEASKSTAKRTVGSLESNPLGILVGGLAVGALAGALIPRSAREKELLAPIGKRIGETIVAATAAAKDAGRSELGELGLTKDNARDQAKGLLEGIVKAVTTAGTAGAKAVSQKPVA